MSDTLSELERKAMKGYEMPKGLNQSQQIFYLSMVKLYELYRNRTYTRSQAHDMKQELINTYRNNEFRENLLEYHAQICNRYSEVLTEAEKHGCPICEKLVKIFDGRERIKMKEREQE